MTNEQFDKLKPGDRIDGRNRGDGTVERNGDVLIIRWDRDGAITYQLSVLRDLWGSWSASPMAHWIVNPMRCQSHERCSNEATHRWLGVWLCINHWLRNWRDAWGDEDQ